MKTPLEIEGPSLGLRVLYSGMSLVTMGMHAMVDFNLHIPANAAVFMVLVALPWTLRRRNHGENGFNEQSNQ